MLCLFFLIFTVLVANAQTVRGNFVFSGNYESGVFTSKGDIFNVNDRRRKEIRANYGNFSVGYFLQEGTLLTLNYFGLRYKKDIVFDSSSLPFRGGIPSESADYVTLSFSKQTLKRRFRALLKMQLVVGRTKGGIANSNLFFEETGFRLSEDLHAAIYAGCGFRNFLRNGQTYDYGIDFRILKFGESFSALRGYTLASLYFKPTILYNPKKSQRNTVYSYPLIPKSQLQINAEIGNTEQVQILAYHPLLSEILRFGYGVSVLKEENQGGRTPISYRTFFLIQGEVNLVDVKKERKYLPFIRLRYELKSENFSLFYSRVNRQTLKLHNVHARTDTPLQIYYGLGFVKNYDNRGSFNIMSDRFYRQVNLEAGLEYYISKNFSIRYDISSLWFELNELPINYRTIIPSTYSQLALNIYLLQRKRKKDKSS